MKLAAWQAAFMSALWDEASDALPSIAAQPGFAVYRNTVMKGLIDALAANYPAVASLVGPDWFRAAAAVFVRESPPRQASLLDYGAGYPDFLARFPPAAELPYLAAVARLDRHWTESHLAPDGATADPAALAAAAPTVLARLRLVPHPATRWLWVEDAPVHRLWLLNRGLAPMPADGLASLHWRAEGALTTREHDTVVTRALPRAGCALLDASADGQDFASAAAAALSADATVDLPELVAMLLRAGAFMAPDPLIP